jgi:SAM-dependent methyltransferase
LPLADNVATRIICQEVLEHVENPEQIMEELVRVGRPGALYLLTAPDPASEELQKALAHDSYWRPPNHLRIFGRDEFDDLVRQAGLAIHHRTHFSSFWTIWWTLFWADKGGFEFGSPGTPVLKYWNKTWAALLEAPQGEAVRKALDEYMPKSQVIVARKAA